MGPSTSVRYFITFSCYGAHLHGDESGSVDRRHHLFGSPTLDVDPRRAATERRAMTQPPYSLTSDRRSVVQQAIRQVCSFRNWNLLAAHVRSNHVHVVVEAEVPPEKVMRDLKAYASRALTRLSDDQADRKRWARHGRTRWLFTDQSVRAAIRNVVDEQGAAMAVFLGPVP
jgi:REP element-mobilizing transposase RayT